MINGKIAVHIYGPLLSLAGYGVACRQIVDYCLSDDRFIVFLESVQWGNCAFISENTLVGKGKIDQYYQAIARYQQSQQQNIQFDISIYCTIPNEFKRRAQICIGMTAGIEVDRVTRTWIHACNMMDLVVVPSEFARDNMQKTMYEVSNNQTGEKSQERIEKQVLVIPHWFEKPETIKPLTLPITTSKNLLFVGMWGNKGNAGEDRKDISTLVKLFYETFKDDSDVGLVLKTEIIVDSHEDFAYTEKKLKEIKSHFKDAKCKVHLLHQMMTEEEMWALYSHPKITGYISLGPEGFCLPALEALASGLPVLALNATGHLDFCKKGKGFLPIAFDMKQVPDCQVWENVIDKEAMWARVDEEDAKRRMKKFISSPNVIKAQVLAYQKELVENFEKSNVIPRWKAFFDSFIQPKKEHKGMPPEQIAYQSRKETEIEKIKTRYNIEKSDKEKVLYVMPMSFGDIVISTCIVDSLINARHADSEVYFATKKEYHEVLDGLVGKHNIKVIEYDDILINSELTREIWDTVYTPGVNVQYNFSNWTLGNGKYALNLLQEFAKQCNLTPPELTDYVLLTKQCKIPDAPYVCLTAVSSKDAKKYKYWEDVVVNIKEMVPGIEVVQFGTKSEDKINGTIDCRGLSFNETMFVVKNAAMHIGPDTGMGHAAAALGVPHVVLFASTEPNQCAPHLLDLKALQMVVDSTDGCGKPRSYKDVCTHKVDGINCLSRIDPELVCEQIYKLFQGIEELQNDPKMQKYLDDQRYLPMMTEQEAFDSAIKNLKKLRDKQNGQKETIEERQEIAS